MPPGWKARKAAAPRTTTKHTTGYSGITLVRPQQLQAVRTIPSRLLSAGALYPRWRFQKCSPAGFPQDQRPRPCPGPARTPVARTRAARWLWDQPAQFAGRPRHPPRLPVALRTVSAGQPRDSRWFRPLPGMLPAPSRFAARHCPGVGTPRPPCFGWPAPGSSRRQMLLWPHPEFSRSCRKSGGRRRPPGAAGVPAIFPPISVMEYGHREEALQAVERGPPGARNRCQAASGTAVLDGSGTSVWIRCRVR